ncbi:hypothetical protein V6N13_046377 [Hibiscus sabdariffa]
MREGDEPKVPNEDDDIINWVVRVNEKSNIAKSPIVNSETEDPSNFSKGRGYVPKRALKDVSDMGLSSAVGVLVQNATKHMQTMPSGLQSDEESPRAFFSELSDGNITRKPKRYGSLWDFQEKGLSELEKKKKERVFWRSKLSKKNLDASELSGRSLSDFDLSTWRNILTKEAKKALKL